jgi:hypothetical protein
LRFVDIDGGSTRDVHLDVGGDELIGRKHLLKRMRASWSGDCCVDVRFNCARLAKNIRENVEPA